MKKLAVCLVMILWAGAASAGVIYDLQIGGVYAEGDWILVEGAVVTATATYGAAIAEAPYGPGNSVWVYLGSGHTAQVGDVVNVYGVYAEYYDLTEINVADYPPDSFFDVFTTMEVPDPIVLTAGEIMADPEPYESSIVLLSDGFIVSDLLSYGEWLALSHEDGVTEIQFDDFWYDETVLQLGDCANNATGMWTYAYGAFKLEPFVDGFPLVGCPVAEQKVSFGAFKALYR